MQPVLGIIRETAAGESDAAIWVRIQPVPIIPIRGHFCKGDVSIAEDMQTIAIVFYEAVDAGQGNPQARRVVIKVSALTAYRIAGTQVIDRDDTQRIYVQAAALIAIEGIGPGQLHSLGCS